MKTTSEFLRERQRQRGSWKKQGKSINDCRFTIIRIRTKKNVCLCVFEREERERERERKAESLSRKMKETIKQGMKN